MTDRRRMLGAVRYVLAAVVIGATLLTIAAAFRQETCSCKSPAFRYSTVAFAAVAVDAAAIAAYVATGAMARWRDRSGTGGNSIVVGFRENGGRP
jgi:hypothetical protein